MIKRFGKFTTASLILIGIGVVVILLTPLSLWLWDADIDIFGAFILLIGLTLFIVSLFRKARRKDKR